MNGMPKNLDSDVAKGVDNNAAKSDSAQNLELGNC
jgi:hypothetical protein